ncbi:MAG: hypothetical protein K0U59_03350 [Gammaproteobacteria bacterium]|nr:hypothetical protein [Gammaproteobacteria bacterium]
MARVALGQIALARSGDKGSGSNIGVIARSPQLYTFLSAQLTTAVIKEAFKEICLGDVVRYELPNLNALNFLLANSLGGGGTEAMITDAQGKVHGPALLHIKMDVPEHLLM